MELFVGLVLCRDECAMLSNTTRILVVQLGVSLNVIRENRERIKSATWQ